jgi:hypothetical protein
MIEYFLRFEIITYILFFNRFDRLLIFGLKLIYRNYFDLLVPIKLKFQTRCQISDISFKIEISLIL